jgi:hypothetical protein
MKLYPLLSINLLYLGSIEMGPIHGGKASMRQTIATAIHRAIFCL